MCCIPAAVQLLSILNMQSTNVLHTSSCSVVINIKHAIYKLWIFFKMTQNSWFWPQIIIIIIEISLKKSISIQNKNEMTLVSRGLCRQFSKFIFLPVWQVHNPGVYYLNICHGLHFHGKDIFFLMFLAVSST